MANIRVLQDITVYNSITAISGVTTPEMYGVNNKLIVKPSHATNDDRYLIVEPTGPSDIHIRAGGASDESTANLRLGGEFNHVQVSDSEHSVSFTTGISSTDGWKINDNLWKFKTEEIVPALEYKHSFYLPTSAHIGQDNGVATWHGTLNFTGNLNVAGSATFHNTEYTTTSSISVTNTGTGPALVVKQTGEQAIASFYDDSNIALYIDGRAATPGYVGIGTKYPNKTLTVVGDISATGIIYGSGTISKFVSAFGNSSDLSYTIAHNLNAQDVVVSIVDAITQEVVYPLVKNTAMNQVTVDFSIAPGLNAYKAIIVG